MKKTDNNQPKCDVYFWLGADGELEECDAGDFAKREAAERARIQDYSNGEPLASDE